MECRISAFGVGTLNMRKASQERALRLYCREREIIGLELPLALLGTVATSILQLSDPDGEMV